MALYFITAGVIFVLDLGSKMVVREFIPLGSEISILPFFSLVHLQNTGIAFGLFQGRNLLFLLLGLAMASFIGWIGISLAKKSAKEAVGIGLILGGAIGNIVDRIFFGRVTDFLDFFIGTHHWPAFNVADSAICVGAFLMVLEGLLKKHDPIV